jgi:hypothetical protein
MLEMVPALAGASPPLATTLASVRDIGTFRLMVLNPMDRKCRHVRLNRASL